MRRKGVAGLVVLSAGFGEVAGGAPRRRRRCATWPGRNGMRLVGPNCIGVANTAVGLNATFSPSRARPGPHRHAVAVGGAGHRRPRTLARIGLGVSSFVSVGNKADVSGNDLLQYWEDDPGTDVVLLYLESFGNPRKFSRIARRVSRRKPIVAVKSGRSAAGVRAASSHTAAMASPDVAVDALFRQTGVIRVDTLDELFDMALLLGSASRSPPGRRVAIVGNSGGPRDPRHRRLRRRRPRGPRSSAPETQAALRDRRPQRRGANPVDLVASATPEIYEQALRLTLADEASMPSSSSAPPPSPPARRRRRRSAAGRGRRGQAGASAASWPHRSCRRWAGDGAPCVPAFPSPEPAARALARAATYAEWRRRPPGAVPELDGFDLDRALRSSRARRGPEDGVGCRPTRSTTCSAQPAYRWCGRERRQRRAGPARSPPSWAARWRSRRPGRTSSTRATWAACSSTSAAEADVERGLRRDGITPRRNG